MSNQVHFNIPDDLVVAEGVCAVICWDEQGKQYLQISHTGTPAIWSQVGLFEAGADRAKDKLRKAWGDA